MKSSKFIFLKGTLLLIVVVAVISVAGYLLRTVSQNSLESDMSLVALSVAQKKIDTILAKKANFGYDSVKPESEEIVYLGRWGFIQNVDVVYVDSNDFKIIPNDMGLKKIIVNVAWSRGVGKSVKLYSIISNIDSNIKISPKPIMCGGGV